MAARAMHSTNRTTDDRGGYDAVADYGDWDLSPDDRLSGPPKRRRGKMVAGTIAALMIAGAGAWFTAADSAVWRNWLPADLSVSLPPALRVALGLAEPAKPVDVPTAPPRIVDETSVKPTALDEMPAAPSAREAKQVPPLLTVKPVAVAALPSDEASPAAPLPPPKVDPADPFQKRALAVGLHPELSRVLLERLSDADYRNAGIAIRTALSETADGAVLSWPQQRKPDQALFQVRFVPGIADDCRRYVVAITKDGWLTTALPLEKCGIRANKTARPANRAG